MTLKFFIKVLARNLILALNKSSAPHLKFTNLLLQIYFQRQNILIISLGKRNDSSFLMIIKSKHVFFRTIYTFMIHSLYISLKEFSRVICGVLLSVPETMEDLNAMKRLWVHEVRICEGNTIDMFVQVKLIGISLF